MKIFSLDLETTGLNENEHQIIEVGGVIDDLENPKDLEDLPEFHCYVTHDTYNVSEFCLGMHSETGIFEKISNRDALETYIPVDLLPKVLGSFVWEKYEDEELDERWKRKCDFWDDIYMRRNNISIFPMEVVAAGKNFGAFDMDFFEEVEDFQSIIRFHHRVLDPGPLYTRPSDEKVPNMETCMERAGISGEVTHHAVDDAKVVVKLIRDYYNINY